MIEPWVFEFFPEPQDGKGKHDFISYFDAYLNLWANAERRGFKGIFFSEHHYRNSFSPSPNLLIASVAQRTKTLRLGVMGVVTPFYSPSRIVEEIGMLDQLTGGRLEIGTAVGIPIELTIIGMPGNEARERNDEAIAVLDMALTGKPVTFRGKFFSCENLTLVPRPVQQPAPPKWTTVVSADSARKSATRQSKICTGFNPTARVKEIFDAYRDEADRSDFSVGPDHLALRRRVVVAESQSQATDMMTDVANRMRQQLAKDPRGVTVNFGKKPADNREKAVPDAGGNVAVAEDEFIFGTPDAVAEQIIEQCRHIGAGHFLAVLHWGASFEEISHGHALFGDKVIPHLKRAQI